MFRAILLSAAILGASATTASADSFFFGVSSGPAYHAPAPVVPYWRPGPVYYSGAPIYYSQPRRFQHRYFYPRPVYHHHVVNHHHGYKHSHGRGGHGGHGRGHGHGHGHRR